MSLTYSAAVEQGTISNLFEYLGKLSNWTVRNAKGRLPYKEIENKLKKYFIKIISHKIYSINQHLGKCLEVRICMWWNQLSSKSQTAA